MSDSMLSGVRLRYQIVVRHLDAHRVLFIALTCRPGAHSAKRGD